MPAAIETIIGAIIICTILLDVFLTVLYARMGSSILARRTARIVWHVFRWTSPKGKARASYLSFCGPVIVVSLLAMWFLGLTLGAALIIHPQLGTGVVATTGRTSRTFVSALFAGGDNVSIIGSNAYSPTTGRMRLFYLVDGLIGTAVTSLCISYIMQVYSGLQKRNTLGLKIDLLSASTGDAAELLAGLVPQGNASAGYTNVAEMAAEIAEVKEAHHFYPVLFFFRFQDSFYSVAHITLITSDLVSLIKAALDDDQYAWFKESASVTSLGQGSVALARTLERNFLSTSHTEKEKKADAKTIENWTRRYDVALFRLGQAGIKLRADTQEGLRIYLRERENWDRDTTALAPVMGYTMADIDPACWNPDKVRERQPFSDNLHTVPEHREDGS